jgi:antitoxin component of MazEF toxin-antitoxin module
MRTHIEKCPGGLAVVVPGPLAAQVGLRDGGPAEIELTGDRLVIRLAGPATLAELLAGLTHDNLHEEWAAGPPTGVELL